MPGRPYRSSTSETVPLTAPVGPSRVKEILGHKHINTTLGYARLYDGTLAADYYQAMAQVEKRLSLPEDGATCPPDPAQLLALLDALGDGLLSEAQAEAVRALRLAILSLAEREIDAAHR